MWLSEQRVELSIAMENVSDIFEVYSNVEQLTTQSHATFVGVNQLSYICYILCTVSRSG